MSDVDGDGDLDAVTANQRSDDICVAFNDGIGGFASQTRYSAGNHPTALELGDLDGDGDVDIVVANDVSDNLTVLLGDGSGAFIDGAPGLVIQGLTGLSLGDIDLDGDLDIASIRMTSDDDEYDEVVILQNDGDNGFIVIDSHLAGERIQDVEFGDLDGDGDTDIAAVSNEGRVTDVFFNDGHGGYSSAVSYQNPGLNRYADGLALGDVDDDGDLDIAVTSGEMALLINQGDGGFEPGARHASEANVIFDVSLEDVDDDGDLDCVMGSQLGVHIYFNSGGGTFAPEIVYDSHVSTTGVAVGDVDSDGDVDLIASGNSSDEIRVLLADGGGAFWAAEHYAVQDNRTDGALGDLDNDGDLDLVTLGGIIQQDDLLIHLNDGGGELTPAYSYNAGSRPKRVRLADLNQDGFLDAIASNSENSIQHLGVFVGVGDGSFEERVSYDAGGKPWGFAIGDVDGDMDLDIVTTSQEQFGIGDAGVIFNTGGGVFSGVVMFEAGPGPFDVALGDLDGDGDLDAAMAQAGIDEISIHFNTGEGVFQDSISYASGEFPTRIALGDLNFDGALDIVAGSSPVSVYLNTGSGSFSGAMNYDADGMTVRDIHIVDLDSDGALDVAVVAMQGSELVVYRNAGDGTLKRDGRYGVGRNPEAIEVGDLDGDTDLDVVAISPDSFRVLRQRGEYVRCVADLAWPCDVINFDDLLAFLTAFGASEPAADLAEPYGEIDFDDVLAFLVSFGAGCP